MRYYAEMKETGAPIFALGPHKVPVLVTCETIEDVLEGCYRIYAVPEEDRARFAAQITVKPFDILSPTRASLGLPRRRYELKIAIGADDVKSLRQALREIMLNLAQRDDMTNVDVVSGAPQEGFWIAGDEDPSVTHDSYFDAVSRWKGTRGAE